jgi:hypothetical protein
MVVWWNCGFGVCHIEGNATLLKYNRQLHNIITNKSLLGVGVFGPFTAAFFDLSISLLFYVANTKPTVPPYHHPCKE